ncbi:hypothetical protein EG68_07433 [Paragonimus skrjabini miyazakii]|uniref:Uncharacterized protein n=1 Tax=Paragonimus skrjabini miyazakii TaxID=59628 RepID=A0A8S9YSD8_9TREM|nr:hypothetical protein EG68_07433 [Paragonimus skrjabini miyazakii]
MQVATQKLDCIQKWIEVIILKRPTFEDNQDTTLLELIDLMKEGRLLTSTASTDLYRVVLDILSDFYAVDVAEVLLPTKTDSINYSVYGKCCLLLLVLAMGLRLKCKLFMSAAFKLPAALHYTVVEMTQPLIDDSPISLTSFSSLTVDSENRPSTPVGRNNPLRTFPVTCPVGGRMPFSVRVEKSDVTVLAINDERQTPQTRCRSPSTEHYLSPVSATSPNRLFGAKTNGLRLRNPALRSIFDTEFEQVDSPLYSLKTILDSPNLIPKSHYLTKLEELREVSAQLAEVRHLYEETNMEVQRLNSCNQNLELQCKEFEIKLKHRELELRELKDELACEQESRLNCEGAAQHSDRLRERLNCAFEELKSLSKVAVENTELHKEVSQLRAQVKSLESLRPRLIDQQLLRHQLESLKEKLRVADEKVLQLICEREESLAATLAASSAKSLEYKQHLKSCDAMLRDGCATCHPVNFNFSPDSSQPGMGEELENQREGDKILVEGIVSSVCDSQALTNVISASYTPENLASVVAVNEQIASLESALSATKVDFQDAKRQIVRWQCRAIAAKALSFRRLESFDKVATELTVAISKTSQMETFYAEKFTWMETQLTTMKSRLQSAEESVNSFDRNYVETQETWIAREKKLRAELEHCEQTSKIACSELTEQLQMRIEEIHQKDSKIYELETILEETKAEAAKKIEALKQSASLQQITMQKETTEMRCAVQHQTDMCERLTKRLQDQLKANEAYRKTTEEQIDHLRNQLSTLSAERSASVLQKNQEYQALQTRLNVEIQQLKDTGEATSRHAACLQQELEECQEKTEICQQKLQDALRSAELKGLELSELRLAYTDLQQRSEKTESDLSLMKNQVQSLTRELSDKKSCLSELEREKHCLETRCNILSDRSATLEADAQHYQDRIREYKSLIDSAQQDRAETERRCGTLRDQLHLVESDWMHSQAQLSQTRSQLTQVEQLLHETKLKLQRMEYSHADTLERLARCESRRNRVSVKRGWPPYADTTAPISPRNFREGKTYSGNSPERHSRRFCRFILDPEDEPQGDLETKSIPLQPTTCGDTADTQKEMPPTTEHSTLKMGCTAAPCTYIPETPCLWNIPSVVLATQSDNMTKQSTTNKMGRNGSATALSVRSVATESAGTESVDYERQLSLPNIQTSKKKVKIWKLRKILKRKKQLSEDGEVSCTEELKQTVRSAHLSPPSPPHLSAETVDSEISKPIPVSQMTDKKSRL